MLTDLTAKKFYAINTPWNFQN